MKQNKLIVRVKNTELTNMLDELVELESHESSTLANSKCQYTEEFMSEFILRLESFLLPEDKSAPDKYTLHLDAGTFQRYNKRKRQLSQRLASELTKYILDNGHTTQHPIKVGFALETYRNSDISNQNSDSYLEIYCEFSREYLELNSDELQSTTNDVQEPEPHGIQTSESPTTEEKSDEAERLVSPSSNDRIENTAPENILASLITAEKTYHLTKPRTSLGRRESNDIIVSNLAVSRNHAEITVDAGKFLLKDLSSRNGVYLNGKLIKNAEINNNDIISLDKASKINFRFEIVEQYSVIPSDNFLEHFNRGLALRREKRWDSAAKEFFEAIRLGDKSARPYFNIAVIKFHQRDYEQSIENFQKGLEIEQDNAFAHADLGKVYQITEQWEKAIEHFKSALEIEPNHKAANRRLSRIEEVYQIYQDVDSQLSRAENQQIPQLDAEQSEKKPESQKEEIESEEIESQLDADEVSRGFDLDDEPQSEMIAQAELSPKRMEDEFSLDLMIGAEVQQRLMPEVPDFPGLDIAAHTIPARGVSGDYYDFIPDDNQHLWIAVADVSGKSIGGAILMSETRSLLRTNVKYGLPLEAVITQVNNTIYEDTADDKFITMFIGTLDMSNKTFEYCNVGHNPPALYRSQSKELLTLNVGGPVAGVLPDAPYQTERINLANGDALVFYTDGITETMNEIEELFGEDRLHQLFTENASLESQQVIEAISNQVEEFSAGDFEDDATLVVVKVNE